MSSVFKLIIATTGGYADYTSYFARLDQLLVAKHPDVEIVIGFSLAGDQFGRQYAEQHGYPVKVFTAGFLHMEQMVSYCDGACVAWDGVSKGTAKLIDAVRAAGKPCKVVRFEAAISRRKTAPSSPVPVVPRGSVEIDGEVMTPVKRGKTKKAVPAGDNAWKVRYKAAHDADFARQYPSTYKDGHLVDPVYPKVRESNGLQTAVVNYLNWQGHRAKRINNMGRLVDGIEVTESGAKITAKKWLPSAAGKGQADVSATVWHGRSAQLEIKAGNDKPSAHQLKEQAKERRAGGIYEFIHSIEQFFTWYDKTEAQARNNYQQQDIFGG